MRRLPRLSRAVLRVRSALAALFRVERDEPELAPSVQPLTTTTRVVRRSGMNITEDSAIPSDRAASTERIPAFKMAQPAPGVVPGLALDQQMAMDDFTGAAVNWAGLDALDEGLTFMGFPYLAQLTQRAEYRRPSEILAKEMTRRWIRIQVTGDEDKSEKVKQIEDELKRINAQDTFQKAAEMDGFFGRSQIFIDVGQMDPGELAMPLHVSKRKIIRGSLRGLKVIDPIWTYPGNYNSNNPLADDFYKPTDWFIFSQRIHASRLMTLVSRDVPDILKPAYGFGGLSLSQMAKPYIDNWLRTRQSVSDIVHNFSVSVLSTNMGGVLNAGGARQMVLRARLFNQARDNQGLIMLDKDTETFENVSTPLGGLDHLQSQSQEQMSAVVGIPLVILLGITPTGLNASSEGELDAFYAWVEAQQRTLFGPPLKKVIDIIQLSLFGEIDPSITFMFEPLQVLSETDKAAVEKTKVETDAAAISAGIIDPLEARTRLAGDEDGPYSSLDLTKAIAPPAGQGGEEDGEGGDPSDDDDPSGGGPGGGPADPNAPPKPTPGAVKPVAAEAAPAPGSDPRMAGDAGWIEEDHERSTNGEFGSGSGGASGGVKPPVRNETATVTTKASAARAFMPAELYDEAQRTIALYAKEASPTAPLSDAEKSKATNELAKHLAAAHAAKPDYDAKLKAIGEKLGAKVKVAGIKGGDRLLEKHVRENGSNPAEMKDLVRGSLIVQSLDDVAPALEALGKDFKIARVKDRFAAPMASGYSDMLINVELPGGILGEVQIHIPEMIATKGELGHALYDISRKLPDGSALKDQLVELQSRVYGAARSSANQVAESKRLRPDSSQPANSSRESESPSKPALASDGYSRESAPARLSKATHEPSGKRATGMPSTSRNLAPSGKSVSFIGGAPDAPILSFDESYEPLKAAGIMFRAPDGSVLLLKRGAGGDHGGEWCFPGGKVETGESRKEAARREAREEIGEHPEAALEQIDRSGEEPDDGVDFTTFVQKVSAPFVPTLNHEHTAWAWARPDSLPEPMHPGPFCTLTGRAHADAAAEEA